MEDLTAIIATGLKQAGQVVQQPSSGMVRPPAIPAAFDVSDPQRAMEAITSLVNMYHGLDRIKQEIHNIASASDVKYDRKILTEEAAGGKNMSIQSQKKSKQDKKNAKLRVVPSNDQDVASDDHYTDTVSQGTSTSGGSGLKKGVREDQDKASLNAFEEDNKKKKKKGKASSKSNKKEDLD